MFVRLQFGHGVEAVDEAVAAELAVLLRRASIRPRC